MPRTIVITAEEAIQFSASVLSMLVEKGFHVSSLQEAFFCVDSISTGITLCEIMQEIESNKSVLFS